MRGYKKQVNRREARNSTENGGVSKEQQLYIPAVQIIHPGWKMNPNCMGRQQRHNCWAAYMGDRICSSRNSLTANWINSLVPGRCGSNSKCVLLKLVIQNNSSGTHC